MAAKKAYIHQKSVRVENYDTGNVCFSAEELLGLHLGDIISVVGKRNYKVTQDVLRSVRACRKNGDSFYLVKFDFGSNKL